MPLHPPTRRTILSCLLLCLNPIISSNAQVAPPDQPSFKARTELINVPVVVTDKSGAHIRNLTKEDFQLFEDGKERSLAVFEEVTNSHAPGPDVNSQSAQFTNVRTEDVSAQQLMMIVLDLINTPAEDQIYTRNQLRQFLADPANAGHAISIFTVGRTGVKLVHRFSTDPKALIAALKDADGSRPPVVEAPSWAYLPDGKDKASKILRSMGEFQVDSDEVASSFDRRTEATLTLQGLQQIAQACAGLPGRKNLVWASAGFPFVLNETSMTLREGGGGSDTPANMLPLYQETWKMLNQAQIAVYPVDVHGLGEMPGPATVPAKNPLPDPFTHGQWLRAGNIGTFETFAHATAGRAFYNRNNLKAAIQQAVDDSSSYYLLAFYLDHSDTKAGWRTLDVKVKRDGAQVLARTGFLVAVPSGHEQDDARDQVQMALNSPVDYTGIHITGKWQELQSAPEPGKKKLIFVLTMPANFADVDVSNHNHFQVDFWATAWDKNGTVAGNLMQSMEGNFTQETLRRFESNGTDYRGALALAPGEYQVRFVVRDRLSGRMGSVSSPVKVER